MGDSTSTIDAAAAARIAELEAIVAAQQETIAADQKQKAALIAERDRLRTAYQQLQIEIELTRRRLFVAKAERIDTAQLELEFAGKLAELDKLAGLLAPVSPGSDSPPAGDAKQKRKHTPTGRRDFNDLDLPEERVEVVDSERDGVAPRIGAETTTEVRWRRGGFVRVIVTRWKYKTEDMPIVTAPMPPKMIPKSFAMPSLYAHIASEKFCFGLPLYRQEERSAQLGLRIDRGTMSRWLQELGLTVGATVVEAMRKEALASAFCIATDATGILVQPIRESKQQVRRACRRAHYFVQIADADHVFFEYTAQETSAAVGEMFRGFSGYVQADAKSVYDFLYRPPEQRVDDDTPDLAVRHEVGCWSHARRRAWETAITTKDPIAREMLARIARIFAHERSWKGRPHVEIKSLRELHLRPHVDAFFEFVGEQYERVRDQRGMLRSALGYAHRQRAALTRFFDDGRLQLTNNSSERELRRVAVGRKAWLFVGSDDHGQAAGNLLTLIASARLHGLDPEKYLCELFTVLPQWPRERYLELSPKYWREMRERINAEQIDRELGWLTIPPPLSSTTVAP